MKKSLFFAISTLVGSFGLEAADMSISSMALLLTPKASKKFGRSKMQSSSDTADAKLQRRASSLAGHRTRSWNMNKLYEYEELALERGAILDDGSYATIHDALEAAEKGYFNDARSIRIVAELSDDGKQVTEWKYISIADLGKLCPETDLLFGIHRNNKTGDMASIYEYDLQEYEKEAIENGAIVASGAVLSGNHVFIEGYYRTLHDALQAAQAGFFNPTRQIRIISQINQDGTVSWRFVEASDLSVLCILGKKGSRKSMNDMDYVKKYKGKHKEEE